MIKIKVPGSKSITNRALIAASLAKGKSILKNALESDDTRVMRKALKQSKKREKIIYCGNSGITIRFLAAILATGDFEYTLDGDSCMRQRPIKDLVDTLNQLGVDVEYLNKNGFPPIKIKGPFTKNTCKIKGSTSSQFLSGLLMAAPLSNQNLTIIIEGKLVSKPYVDMTIDVMRKFGIRVERSGYKKFLICRGQKYKAANLDIEGDASSASYFWGISALTGEDIEVTNVPRDSAQPDIAFLKKLNLLTKTINCSDFPDSAMTLAVLCAFRKGIFRFKGLSNLRVKECDRLHALSTELNKIGCKIKELSDGLIIHGDPEKLHGAVINTYNDHRMAMCFGMASVILQDIKIQDRKCVSKTYPNFWKDFAMVKKKLNEKNIVLTGMRGSGKTKIGRLLAKKLKRRFIDIDEEIIKTAKLTIPKIVERYGWRYFRKLERKISKKISKLKSAVIATGGGTLMYPANVKNLKKNGRVIFLKSSIKSLQRRLRNKKNRPSLSGKKDFIAELKDVYKNREDKYYAAADEVIDVSLQSKNVKKDLKIKLEKIIRI